MKKLLTLLLAAFMLFSMVGCSSPATPTTQEDKKEVASIADFKEIGIDLGVSITDFSVSDVKYYIVDKNIAEIDFVNGDNNYVFRASKEAGAGKIVDIESEPNNKVSSTIDGVSYSVASYPEGLVAIWIYDMTTYSLFGKDLTEDENYEFFRMLEIITGMEILEQPVELPTIDSNTTKDSLELWFNENGFKDVDWEYENSDSVEADHVIKVSREGKVYPSDEIIVTVSTGPKKPDIVTVPDNLLGYDEGEFIKLVKGLGLEVNKGSTKYYSTTIKAGNIFDYDDGKFPTGTIIKYHVSRGRYEFDSEEFNGLSKAKAQEHVDYLNNLNAHVTLKLEEHQTEKHDPGTVYKCTGAKDGIKMIVSCSLAVKKPDDPKVDLPNFVGTYNNPCGTKDACTVNSIHYIINYENDGNPEGYISAQTVPAGKVDPGTNVRLIVTARKAYIYSIDSGRYAKGEGGDFDTTVSAMRGPDFFGDFYNVDYVGVYNDAHYDGEVLEVAIYDNNQGRWTTMFAEGYYPISTRIRVTVNDFRIN